MDFIDWIVVIIGCVFFVGGALAFSVYAVKHPWGEDDDH
jgi:hypothetical protein